MTLTKRRISSLSLLAGALLLLVMGPDWPTRTTALICGETMVEKRVLPDMEACMVAMDQAAESGADCFCSVKANRFAPLYYWALVPLMCVTAIRMLSARTARGMAAVIVLLVLTTWVPGVLVSRMYQAGMRIPDVLANLAIPWPQLVFFVPTMFWATPGEGLVFSQDWALLIMLAFWLVAALAFGLMTRRFASTPLVACFAMVFIVGVAVAARVAAPLVSWKMVMEFP